MYLNLIQIAESFGVSEKVVKGWIRDEGLPHTPDRGILLFDRAQVAQWATTRGLAAKAGFLAPDSAALTSALRIAPLLRTGGIWRDVGETELVGVFVRVALALPGATPAVREMVGRRLLAQGGVTMAPIGGGYALPHPSARITLGRESGAVALIMLREGLPLSEPRVDEVPISRLFFFIAPSPRTHLDIIGRLNRFLSRGSLAEFLAKEVADEAVFQALEAADEGASKVCKQGGTR